MLREERKIVLVGIYSRNPGYITLGENREPRQLTNKVSFLVKLGMQSAHTT